MLWRLFKGFVIALLLIVLLALGFGYYYARTTTLPQTNGRLPLAGLSATAEILRDDHGVLLVKAQSLPDLFFAQGVAHAQERLWQMEFQRRLGAGRLAEVLGPAALPTDKFMRTLGVYRAAEAAYRALSPATRDLLDAYVAGINAYLKSRPPLPLEFKLLGYRPEPWKPADVLVWAKLMSWELSKNYDQELLRYRLLARGLTKERINQLMPPYPEDAPTVVRSVAARPAPADERLAAALLSEDRALFPHLGASNNWVVAPQRTTTGGALLANDPHLRLTAPSIWILMELAAPGFHAVGASFPGLPGIVIGRNDAIAWGVTNMGPDVQDLYVLKEAKGGYAYKGEVRPYRVRRETIRVKGAKPVILNVRETIYGPVISDAVDVPGGQPLALRWVSLDPGDTTLEAFLKIDQAKDWETFKAALKYYVAPSQNFVFADRKGNIGYYAPGRIPIRKPGHTGAYPVPGNGEWDWQGWIPFDRLPHAYNPPEGYIVTANNKAVPKGYPYLLEVDWNQPFRAMRIEELIRAKGRLSLADMRAIQLDQVSLLFRLFRPVLAKIQPESERARAWKERLLAWDGNETAKSEEATVFEAWYTELTRLPQAEVGERYWDRPRYLLAAMQHGDPACRARGTSCLAFAAQAFEAALDRLGPEIKPWGQLHPAVFAHLVMSKDPRVRPIFERRIAHGGDRYTVNVGIYRPEDFRMFWGPSYRELVDLARPEKSLFIHPMGQSGNVLSRHYADLLPLWARGEYLPMRAGKPRARLVLEPTP